MFTIRYKVNLEFDPVYITDKNVEQGPLFTWRYSTKRFDRYDEAQRYANSIARSRLAHVVVAP